MSDHTSDCAVHNEPAYLAGSCDCNAPRPWRAVWSMVGRWLVYVTDEHGDQVQLSLPSHMKAEAHAIAAALECRDAARVARGALDKCAALFCEIKNDFTDPRSECRQGRDLASDAADAMDAAIAKAEGQQ